MFRLLQVRERWAVVGCVMFVQGKAAVRSTRAKVRWRPLEATSDPRRILGSCEGCGRCRRRAASGYVVEIGFLSSPLAAAAAAGAAAKVT
jgi:hypothetical protein